MQPWEQYLPAGASPASKAYAKLMWERGVRPQKVGSKWVWDPGPDPVHNPPGLGATQGGTAGLVAGSGPDRKSVV